ncbi:MAG: GNAT family N-acetyltransferase [Candidatus Omnitrophica bacterium]|nr:GNAT family N-acetyltransferase [Candidatus Omnitrophota bacterium]
MLPLRKKIYENIKKVKFYYERRGPFFLLKKICEIFIKINWFILVTHSLENKMQFLKPRVDVDIKQVKEEEFVDILVSEDKDYLKRLGIKKGERSERHKMEHICIAAFHKGRLCGYVWFSVGHIKKYYSGDYTITPSRTAYCFDGFILPEFRRLRITCSIISYGMNVARDCLCKKIIALVSMSNIASRKLLNKLGFNKEGSLIVMAIFKKYKIIIPIGVKRDLIYTIESLKGEGI